MHQDKSAT